MEFEWDFEKSERNRRLRGFGFDEAALIFEQPCLEWQDSRHDYGEARMVAVGRTGGTFYTVVYVDRASRRRIIAAWPSHRKERERWARWSE